jgi:hypothetical protein
MIGFEGRHQWRQHQLFKLRAKPSRREKSIKYKDLLVTPVGATWLTPHPKFAIRSILVRRTRIEQAMENCVQASSVAFAAMGFGAAPSPGFILNS